MAGWPGGMKQPRCPLRVNRWMVLDSLSTNLGRIKSKFSKMYGMHAQCNVYSHGPWWQFVKTKKANPHSLNVIAVLRIFQFRRGLTFCWNTIFQVRSAMPSMHGLLITTTRHLGIQTVRWEASILNRANTHHGIILTANATQIPMDNRSQTQGLPQLDRTSTGIIDGRLRRITKEPATTWIRIVVPLPTKIRGCSDRRGLSINFSEDRWRLLPAVGFAAGSIPTRRMSSIVCKIILRVCWNRTCRFRLSRNKWRNRARKVLLVSIFQHAIIRQYTLLCFRLWSMFFICVRQKIQGCSNHKQFTEGLKEPISSLQKICTDEEYQQSELIGDLIMFSFDFDELSRTTYLRFSCRQSI